MYLGESEREGGGEETAKLVYVTAGVVIGPFDRSPVQLLASEEYQASKRVSVYLSMPTEVDTEPVLKVRPLKNTQCCRTYSLFYCRAFSTVAG